MITIGDSIMTNDPLIEEDTLLEVEDHPIEQDTLMEAEDPLIEEDTLVKDPLIEIEQPPGEGYLG